MAGFNFASKQTAIRLRDMVEGKEIDRTTSGNSQPEGVPDQFRNVVFITDEEIAAADLDGASSEFNFGDCSMYVLGGTSSLTLTSMGKTIKVINPSDEAIPSGTVIWGVLAYGNLGGTAVYVANIWSC